MSDFHSRTKREIDFDSCVCHKCLNKLSNIDESLYEDFVIICDYFYYYKKPLWTFGGIEGMGADKIQKLEQLGYITTTERNEFLIYCKPIGYYKESEDNKIFVACKRGHL